MSFIYYNILENYFARKENNMKHVNTDELNALLNGDKPVIIDFYATWCGPCKMLAPVFEEVSASYPDCEFVKVNVDEETEHAKKYAVAVIPTLVAVKNGSVTGTTKGYMNADELKAFVDGCI